MTQNYTIQRCPHDSENPYTMINRDLIRDESISPECRWLLIYLLSMQDGWIISISQIRNHLKNFMGRNRVRKLFDEAIEAGYILREVKKTGNLNNGYIYFVSERPKFKKCFRQTENRASEMRGPDEQPLRISIPNKNKHMEEERESAAPPPLSPPIQKNPKEEEKKAPESKRLPQEAFNLAEVLLSRVEAIHHSLKKPDLVKWAKEIDLMARADKRSWDEIGEMIAWIFEDAFWFKVIESPNSLRKHWNKIMRQRSTVSNKGTIEKKNRQIAQEIKNYLTNCGKGNLLWIGGDFVKNIQNGDSITFDLPIERFEEILCNWFNLRKMS